MSFERHRPVSGRAVYCRGWRRAWLAAGFAFCIAPSALGEPWAPTDPATVIAELPDRTGPQWTRIDELRRELAAAPDDQARAARLIRAYLDVFEREGDPRLLGFATAVVQRFDSDANLHPGLGLQGAALAATQHRFDDAAAGLDALLARDPRNSQAWLARANLHLVRGDPAASERACSRLILLEDPAVAGACLAAVQAMTGRGEQAYAFLSGQLEQNDTLPDPIDSWIATLAAETAVALGRDDEATHHFMHALQLDLKTHDAPRTYLLGAWADHLLRLGDAEAVLELTENVPPSDAALLRRARAERMLGLDASARTDALAASLRPALDGLDATHAREAAYLALHLQDDAELATRLARVNWTAQREVIDAALVLSAALQSCRPELAAPVMRWMRETQLEHAVLQSLTEAIEQCS